MEIKEYMKQLGNVRPNENQLRWFDMEMYAFIHFSPNTGGLFQGNNRNYG